jgi:hypothetical protein
MVIYSKYVIWKKNQSAFHPCAIPLFVDAIHGQTGRPARHWHGHGQAQPYAARRPIVSCCLVPPCRSAGTGTTLKGSDCAVPCHRARRNCSARRGTTAKKVTSGSQGRGGRRGVEAEAVKASRAPAQRRGGGDRPANAAAQSSGGGQRWNDGGGTARGQRGKRGGDATRGRRGDDGGAAVGGGGTAAALHAGGWGTTQASRAKEQRKHMARRRDWMGWVGVRKMIRLGNIYLGFVVG